MFTDQDFIPRCMKISVLIMNVLYWLLGVIGIGVGLYVHLYQIVPIQPLISVQFSPAFMLVLMETILFVAAMFGFVGTLRENITFLRWYLVTLLMLLMLNISMGVVAFVVMFSPPTVKLEKEAMLQSAVITYNDDHEAANLVNKIQTMAQCCGVGEHGYKDWKLNPYFACSADNYNVERCGVPASCCRFDSLDILDLTCGFGMTQSFISQTLATSIINVEGCVPKAEEMIERAAEFLCFSAFGTAITIICGIILCSRMVLTLQKEVDKYWEQYSGENTIVNRYPKSVVYYIPESEIVQNLPNSKYIVDGILPMDKSYFIM